METALVERLVTDAAGEPGVLPMVQETLVLMWEHLERRFLPLKAYEALILSRREYGGGPERTGLQVAMACRADATLASLSSQQQAIARRIFLRLIQFGEGRADTRRQQPVEALRSASDDPTLFDQTLDHLTQHRLLTLSGEEKESGRAEGDVGRKVDIAHEALINGWPQLQEWLTERREAEQIRRRLEAKATEWARLGQGKGGLLDETELPEAEHWLASPDAADLGYNKALPVLVQKSRKIIMEAEQEKEAARRRELEAARKLAEEQQKLAKEAEARQVAEEKARKEAEQRAKEQQKLAEEAEARQAAEENARLEAEQREKEQARARKRSNRLSIGLAVVFLVAVGVAVFAWLQQQEAKSQRDYARKQTERAEAELAKNYWSNAVNAERNQNWLQALHFLTRFAQIEQETSQIKSVILSIQDYMQMIFLGCQIEHQDAIDGVVFSKENDVVLTWSRDNTARVWNTKDGLPVTAPLNHDDDIQGAAFSPDERLVLTWSFDGTARLWNAKDGVPVSDPLIHGDRVIGATFSRDGNFVLTWSWDGTARLWNTADGSPAIPQPLKHGNTVLGAMFSRDERRILTWSVDFTARLWNVSDGSAATQPMKHGSAVGGASFSQDEDLILTRSDDWGPNGTVRLWNAQDGSPAAQLIRCDCAIKRAIFTQDDRVILIWGSDGRIRTWPIDADEDFPKEYLPLLVEVVTGTVMDDLGNVTALSLEAWLERKERYVEIAEKHLQTCQYQQANLYQRQKQFWEHAK